MDMTDDELRMHGDFHSGRRRQRNLGGQSAEELDQIQRAIAAGVREGIREGLADLRNEVSSLRAELQGANRTHSERLGTGLQRINTTLVALLPTLRKKAPTPANPAKPVRKPPPSATGS